MPLEEEEAPLPRRVAWRNSKNPIGIEQLLLARHLERASVPAWRELEALHQIERMRCARATEGDVRVGDAELVRDARRELGKLEVELVPVALGGIRTKLFGDERTRSVVGERVD